MWVGMLAGVEAVSFLRGGMTVLLRLGWWGLRRAAVVAPAAMVGVAMPLIVGVDMSKIGLHFDMCGKVGRVGHAVIVVVRTMIMSMVMVEMVMAVVMAVVMVMVVRRASDC